MKINIKLILLIFAIIIIMCAAIAPSYFLYRKRQKRLSQQKQPELRADEELTVELPQCTIHQPSETSSASSEEERSDQSTKHEGLEILTLLAQGVVREYGARRGDGDHAIREKILEYWIYDRYPINNQQEYILIYKIVSGQILIKKEELLLNIWIKANYNTETIEEYLLFKKILFGRQLLTDRENEGFLKLIKTVDMDKYKKNIYSLLSLATQYCIDNKDHMKISELDKWITTVLENYYHAWPCTHLSPSYTTQHDKTLFDNIFKLLFEMPNIVNDDIRKCLIQIMINNDNTIDYGKNILYYHNILSDCFQYTNKEIFFTTTLYSCSSRYYASENKVHEKNKDELLAVFLFSTTLSIITVDDILEQKTAPMYNTIQGLHPNQQQTVANTMRGTMLTECYSPLLRAINNLRTYKYNFTGKTPGDNEILWLGDLISIARYYAKFKYILNALEKYTPPVDERLKGLFKEDNSPTYEEFKKVFDRINVESAAENSLTAEQCYNALKCQHSHEQMGSTLDTMLKNIDFTKILDQCSTLRRGRIQVGIPNTEREEMENMRDTHLPYTRKLLQLVASKPNDILHVVAASKAGQQHIEQLSSRSSNSIRSG